MIRVGNVTDDDDLDIMARVLADFVLAVRLAQAALALGDTATATRVLSQVVEEHPRASQCFEQGIALAHAALAQRGKPS